MAQRWAQLVGALLMSLMIALPARGAELRLVAEEEPVAGRDTTLLIVVSDEGRPLAGEAPVIEVDRGSVAGREGEIAPGVWRVRYRAPQSSTPAPRFVLSVEGGRATTTLELRSASAPDGRLVVRETAYAGQTTPVRLRLEGPNLPPAELLEVAALALEATHGKEAKGIGKGKLGGEVAEDDAPDWAHRFVAGDLDAWAEPVDERVRFLPPEHLVLH